MPSKVSICCAVLLKSVLLLTCASCRHCDSEEDEGKGSSGGYGWKENFLLAVLVVVGANIFVSMPHAYESDRLWALMVLIGMDGLLLVIHLYDHVPTMYTICMGRLMYVIPLNICLLCMFYLFKHRLVKYSETVL